MISIPLSQVGSAEAVNRGVVESSVEIEDLTSATVDTWKLPAL